MSLRGRPPRWALGPLVALAASALVRGAPPAHAGEEDQLRWDLGAEALRFDFEEDQNARLAPDASLAPAFVPSQLVSQADFDGGRRWKVDPRETAELLWFYALSLPVGEFAKAGSCPIQDQHRSFPGGVLTATGADEVKRDKGGKTLVKATVELSQPVGKQEYVTYIDKGSKLTVERTYLDKKHQVSDAKFELDLHLVRNGKNFLFHHAGKITLGGKVDASAKGFLTEIQSAIRRGSKFALEGLHKRVQSYKSANPPSQALGHVALPTFALLRSGIPPSELQDCFEFMARCEWKEVYSVSLYIMCLEARSVHREEVPPTGFGRTVARFHKDAVPAADKAVMAKAARWLVAVRKHGEGWWSYLGDPGKELDQPPPGPGTQGRKPGALPAADQGKPIDGAGAPATAGDRSNTQFATLALHVAATSDCPIEPEVWKEIADEIALSQEPTGTAQSLEGVEWSPAAPQGVAPDGGADPFQPLATRSKEQRDREVGEGARQRGWSYPVHTPTGGGSGYGSMSGAGLSSASVAREALRRAGKLDKEADEKTRRMILDGVAWWMANWTPARNPKSSAWYYYYLYSVEKAMETAGVEKLGAHDWWREGCQTLLALEDPKGKGRWNVAGSDDLEDTSFALLFLNRATLPATIVAEDQVRMATGQADPDPEAWDQVFVEGTGHVRLRQVFFAVETATGELVKDRLKVADKGFDVLDEDKRPRLVPDLLRLLGTGQKDIRKFALRALRAACGTEDEARCRAFHARWLDLVRACEARDESSVPKLRAVLKDADATIPLKRAACVGLSRLDGVEALGDLIAELSNPDASYRRQVAMTMVQLAGGEKVPYDPGAPEADRAKQQADWKAWWEKSRTSVVTAQEARRKVEDLGDAGKSAGAEKALRQLGKAAVPALVEGLRRDATKDRALALLREITGQSLTTPQEWTDWWSKNGK